MSGLSNLFSDEYCKVCDYHESECQCGLGSDSESITQDDMNFIYGISRDVKGDMKV